MKPGSRSMARTLVLVALTMALLTCASEANFVMFGGDPPLEQGASMLAPPVPPSTRILYELRMQNDCNLALYDQGTAVWASNTATARPQPRDACSARLRPDGEFVVVDKSGKTLWSSGTAGVSPGSEFVLMLQQDRNLVLYAGPRDGTPQPVWSTRTNLN